jgi:hypothetical protein
MLENTVQKIKVNFILQIGFTLSVSFHECSIHIFILKYHFYRKDKRAKPGIFNREKSFWIPDNIGQKSTFALFQSAKR